MAASRHALHSSILIHYLRKLLDREQDMHDNHPPARGYSYVLQAMGA
jgi:hypothetical protein